MRHSRGSEERAQLIAVGLVSFTPFATAQPGRSRRDLPVHWMANAGGSRVAVSLFLTQLKLCSHLVWNQGRLTFPSSTFLI